MPAPFTLEAMRATRRFSNDLRRDFPDYCDDRDPFEGEVVPKGIIYTPDGYKLVIEEVPVGPARPDGCWALQLLGESFSQTDTLWVLEGDLYDFWFNEVADEDQREAVSDMVRKHPGDTPLWEVVAGNVGTTYSGTDEATARREYDNWVHALTKGPHRADNVVLLNGGNMVDGWGT